MNQLSKWLLAVSCCMLTACAAEAPESSACQRPECRDQPQGLGKVVKYRCPGDRVFAVHYQAFEQEGRVRELARDEVVLVDEQTEFVTQMTRVPSGSGEHYKGVDNLEFWSKGPNAVILQQGKPLYRDCLSM